MEPNYKQLLANLLAQGIYNNEGDFVIEHEPWNGQDNPPDTSDNKALLAAWKAINGE